MMPTRLQNGISMELLQWSLSARNDDIKTILIRLSDEEMFDVIVQNLQNAGLEDIKVCSSMCITGNIKASQLKNIGMSHGVCSVAEVHNRASDETHCH